MNTNYIRNLAERLSFPQEAITYLYDCAVKIRTTDARISFEDAALAHEAAGYRHDGMDSRFRSIAGRVGIHEYTAAMVYLLSACEKLEKRYEARGYSKQLFLDTMSDLRCKLFECKDVKGVWGTFVAGWFEKLLNMKIFTLGRFEYEKMMYDGRIFGTCGNYIRYGDPLLEIHIPSSGVPLTDEIRLDSYKKARDFFCPNATKPVPFLCVSWLLWPAYEDYIPDHLNIKRFRHDFTITAQSDPWDDFPDGWRVFGAKAGLPPEELPTDTTQRRLFAQFCRDGGKHGDAYGLFFFDGEKIIR